MESTEKSSCFIINLTRRAKDHTCLNFLINKAKPTFSFIKFNKQSLLNFTNVTLISQPHPKNGILEKQNYCFFKRLKIKEKIINENKKTGKDSIFGKTEWKKKKKSVPTSPVEVKLLHERKNRSEMMNLKMMPIMGEKPKPIFSSGFNECQSLRLAQHRNREKTEPWSLERKRKNAWEAGFCSLGKQITKIHFWLCPLKFFCQFIFEYKKYNNNVSCFHV